MATLISLDGAKEMMVSLMVLSLVHGLTDCYKQSQLYNKGSPSTIIVGLSLAVLSKAWALQNH